MTLHPIRVVDEVIEEYRSYLRTEFRARDEKLRADLEAALDQPQFLAQEPFFQAHRPYRLGKRWSELPIDKELAKVMVARARQHGSPTPEFTFSHQSEAIEELLKPEAHPVVVSTGTGSGKTECFLLPIIQNAILDSVAFKRSGLTAILVYPMNALANDQEIRIREYLEGSGHTHVKVERYDRTTSETKREEMRASPPHILLTNFMMLEYLLVRPADRIKLFANHRCRFVVLDEVHTYRGTLGANIALLARRLFAHLAEAEQTFATDHAEHARRFPKIIPVATSATIKSVDETGKAPEEVHKLRDEAVSEFFGKLVGVGPKTIRVIGEELADLTVPQEAKWSPQPSTEIQPGAAILFKLNEMLARRPMSMTDIVARIRAEVPERKDATPEALRNEVNAALIAGASLPDGAPGALRLRVHRFIRGGWQFFRCVDPACGKIYPQETDTCECGRMTAPLHLCRSCGADVILFSGDPGAGPLLPHDEEDRSSEWVLYDIARFQEATEEDEPLDDEMQMKGRPVLSGSFDPVTCAFSQDKASYPQQVVLAPARNRCLVCGALAGGRSVITPVMLGTSAAVRVVSEGLLEALARQHQAEQRGDTKERLLIFADSRQDAAHQARFINYAGRYDRMRRRLVRILKDKGRPITLEEAVRGLTDIGVAQQDNPHTGGYEYLPQAVKEKANAWEEAPLLDDLAVSTGYRATLLNLGLMGVRYEHLEEHVAEKGKDLAARLGISTQQLFHLCRCLLDEIRRRGAFSRPMLRYHVGHPNFPEAFREADWERRVRRPAGFACDQGSGKPTPFLESSDVPDGIGLNNFWRKPKGGGKGPSPQRIFADLLEHFGGVEPDQNLLMEVLAFLQTGGKWLTPVTLFGFKQTFKLLQVNADAVLLELLKPQDRCRCVKCQAKSPWTVEGAPCPRCGGTIRPWSDEDVQKSRYVQRILRDELVPLVAREHTAQVTSDERIDIEADFKAPSSDSPVNVLACSPTLEMGIDVGGLDSVVMRNVPPRPDNYAQRGGRAGRRARVGVVLGYTRRTPHDGYFYDKPTEMIAGEVPAPPISLGNREVILRHLNAVVLGAAEPGLAGRMAEYIGFQGELQKEKVDALIQSLASRFQYAADLALKAWGPEVLKDAKLDSKEALLQVLETLPVKIQDLLDRVRLQIVRLSEAISAWTMLQKHESAALHADHLKRRLLGIPVSGKDSKQEADDRTAGHPMRRFAEFGILPGYEFPSEPCTVRLLNDRNENEPISVARHFGISQYQPDAIVHARGHRWRVVGLDLASPWNPKSEDPDWVYVRCKNCDLRYDAQEHPRCKRCGSDQVYAGEGRGYAFGGFLAIRDDTPVLEEEDRFATAALVDIHPQWDGRVEARHRLPTGWHTELRAEEEVRWINEWKAPAEAEKDRDAPRLFADKRGFYLCPKCGRLLTCPEAEKAKKGRSKAKKETDFDPYGHSKNCQLFGQPPKPLAIVTGHKATTYRIVATLPQGIGEEEYRQWGLSLGSALRIGMRHVYMLDGSEIEYGLEPFWEIKDQHGGRLKGAIVFIDSSVGGSGFLERAMNELHLIAARAIDHLDHKDCESACYRCLKSYQNQRFHHLLNWPRVIADLEQLAEAAPEALDLSASDYDDPRPWLEAFDAGVGSPLELKFLRLFEKHGIKVEKQVPVSATEGGAPISIADFAIPEKKIAIYVDGAAFHKGRALRRDRKIRESLKATGWKVVEMTARDLGRPDEILGRL